MSDALNIKELRKKLELSQSEFAMRFGFSLGTLREWEHGRRCPTGAARVLLMVISKSPEIVVDALKSSVRR